MHASTVLESQQSVHAAPAGRTAAGAWKLAAGRALSLHPQRQSMLTLAQGRVWLTLGGPDAADHVLQAGDRLHIAPGQRVVMEAWGLAGSTEGVAFDWDGAVVATAPRAGAEWECSVAQPLRDLAHALAQALGAGGRLAAGVTRFALLKIAPQRAHRPV